MGPMDSIRACLFFLLLSTEDLRLTGRSHAGSWVSLPTVMQEGSFTFTLVVGIADVEPTLSRR